MLTEKCLSDKSKSHLRESTFPEVVEISLEFIRWRDLSTFVRCGIDGDQVNNLKAAYGAGDSVPPVELFAERMSTTSERAAETSEHDRGDALCSERSDCRILYFIGDGWHRFHALRELGRTVIPAIVHQGGRREALKCALGANSGYGLRRTNRDKRKAVGVAIREFPRFSNRAVAELCKVSHEMVNALRSQLADSASSRLGLDGKTRRVTKQDSTDQLDFFELLGREWTPVVKSFDMTIQSVAWLDERVRPERKLEAISAMRRQLDDMRTRLSERERAITAGIREKRQVTGAKTTVAKDALTLNGSEQIESTFA